MISGVKITHICSSVPKNIERVADVACLDDHNRFSKTTGIKERRIASVDTFVSDLILTAVKEIFTSDISLNKSDIDLVVVITQSGDNNAPGVALKIHSEMELKKNCLCFDVNLGCSSYPYGLAIVSSMLSSLNLSKALLCIGDISSKLCFKNDAGTYPLFGDAGSCTVVERSFDSTTNLFFKLYSDGSGRNDIIIKSSTLSSMYPPNQIDFTKVDKNNSHMILNGPNVFSFAINHAPKVINELISSFSLAPDDIFLHQANKKINDFIIKKLSLNDVNFPSSLEMFGNTSSVSIPLTICDHYGVNDSVNKKVLCCGFGVGLSWGAVYFEFNNTKIYGIVQHG